MIESGTIVPIIDHTYNLSEVPEAIRHLEERKVSGKISIRLI